MNGETIPRCMSPGQLVLELELNEIFQLYHCNSLVLSSKGCQSRKIKMNATLLLAVMRPAWQTMSQRPHLNLNSEILKRFWPLNPNFTLQAAFSSFIWICVLSQNRSNCVREEKWGKITRWPPRLVTDFPTTAHAIYDKLLFF